jgi:hypothetical protein
MEVVMKNLLSVILISLITIVFFVGCQSSTSSLKPETLTSDELVVYNLFKDIEKNWIAKDFDAVFQYYADDGDFTMEKGVPASKAELISKCKETYKEWQITSLVIKSISVSSLKANAEAVLKMKSKNGGNTFRENYELEKRSGTWLIVKEINP